MLVLYRTRDQAIRIDGPCLVRVLSVRGELDERRLAASQTSGQECDAPRPPRGTEER